MENWGNDPSYDIADKLALELGNFWVKEISIRSRGLRPTGIKSRVKQVY